MTCEEQERHGRKLPQLEGGLVTNVLRRLHTVHMDFLFLTGKPEPSRLAATNPPSFLFLSKQRHGILDHIF